MSRIISHRSLKLHNRENTLCSQCNQIEDEKHFLCHSTKFVDVRTPSFQKLNISMKDLCPSEYMKTITRLLNPNSLFQKLNINLKGCICVHVNI